MALSACQYCGRQNEADAQFCNDCGKPLTKAAVARAAVAAGSRSGGVSRTSGPPAPGMGAAPDPPAPWRLGGATAAGRRARGGGEPEPRFSPNRLSDHSLTLVLLSEMATEFQRFDRKQSSTAIGRTEGDIRCPDDQFLSPLHAKLSWEEGRLEVRDLGSRNGTWVFLET